MIAALLFDFDGVIVDTEVPTFQAWRETFAEHGVELALEDWLPAVGSGSSTAGAFDAVAHLERLTGRTVDRQAVIARRSRRKAELYARAPLLPGVRERLAEARERGLQTAIVTRNRDDRVRAQCEVVGLDHEWQAVVCANEEPTRDKAELYRHALGVLGVDAGEALAFEDSPAGVLAAKQAGVICAAVPNEVTRGATFDDADFVLTSLADYTLEEIVRLAVSSCGRPRGLQHVRSVAAGELRRGQIIGIEGSVLAVAGLGSGRVQLAVADAYDVDRGRFVIEASVGRLVDVGTAKPDGARGHIYRESRVPGQLEVGAYVNLGGGRIVALVPSDAEAVVRIHVEIVRNWAERPVDERPVEIEAHPQRLFDVLGPLNITLPSRGAGIAID